MLETVESHHLTSEVVQVVLWHDTSATLRDVAQHLTQEEGIRLLVGDLEVANVGVSLCVCVWREGEQAVNRRPFFVYSRQSKTIKITIAICSHLK